jgi:hypothetical protein
MRSHAFAHATRRPRRCGAVEPNLGELLGDPMTLALMAADRVDRRELDALFDRARISLRRHSAS